MKHEISETNGPVLVPFSPSPSSWKIQMQINHFHSNFSYKNMSVGRHWLWNDKPQKSLTKLACGKADLSGIWNWTVTGEAAFCDCNLPLLIGRWGCFMCSFLGVHALLPQLVIHFGFARSFSKQCGNWPCLNLSQVKSILGTQLPEFWWEKWFLCMFFLCSSPFQNCDIKI